MSIYLGKDQTNQFILHTTKGNTSKDSMATSNSIAATTFHTKGDFLNASYHIAETISGNWVKFTLFTMYNMFGYISGAQVQKPYLIIINGRVADRSVFNVWYSSPGAGPTYTSGYNYNFPWIYVPGGVSSAYMLTFDIDISTGLLFPIPPSSTVTIQSELGVYLNGFGRLTDRTYISSKINDQDPIFLDHSSQQIQVVNAYNKYVTSPATSPIKIYDTAEGSSISVAGKDIITSASNMWKVPKNTVYKFFIPHDICYNGGGWNYCRSSQPWRSWISASYNIQQIPSNVRNVLVSFTYMMFIDAGSSKITYGFPLYSTFLLTRGGTAIRVMYATTSAAAGPSGAMSLYLRLSSSGMLYWYNGPTGGDIGGFGIDFYNATFTTIPLNYD